MDIKNGLELIKTAYKSRAEEKLWERWLVDYSRMNKETFKSFTDYLKDAFGNKTGNNKANIKEILEDAEKIKALDQRKGMVEK